MPISDIKAKNDMRRLSALVAGALFFLAKIGHFQKIESIILKMIIWNFEMF